jgi:hypothetical protein
MSDANGDLRPGRKARFRCSDRMAFRVATTVSDRMAFSGWRRPFRERGSWTRARLSTRQKASDMSASSSSTRRRDTHSTGFLQAQPGNSPASFVGRS